VLAVSAQSGMQAILTTTGIYVNDHDHAAATDPILYVQAATDPDTDNTQWGSLTFVAATVPPITTPMLVEFARSLSVAMRQNS